MAHKGVPLVPQTAGTDAAQHGTRGHAWLFGITELMAWRRDGVSVLHCKPERRMGIGDAVVISMVLHIAAAD